MAQIKEKGLESVNKDSDIGLGEATKWYDTQVHKDLGVSDSDNDSDNEEKRVPGRLAAEAAERSPGAADPMPERRRDPTHAHTHARTHTRTHAQRGPARAAVCRGLVRSPKAVNHVHFYSVRQMMQRSRPEPQGWAAASPRARARDLGLCPCAP